MPQTSFDLHFQQAFVVDTKGLSRLNDDIRSFIEANGVMAFDFFCLDGANRRFDKVIQAKDYDNYHKRAVDSIWIRGVSNDKEKQVTVGLTSREFQPNV